jgi:HSP20 family molecular chaperone IbpA
VRRQSPEKEVGSRAFATADRHAARALWQEVTTMTLVRRTPYSEFLSLRDTFDRLFDETIFRPLRFDGKPEIYPLIDLYTTPEAVMIEIALPGIKRRTWTSP